MENNGKIECGKNISSNTVGLQSNQIRHFTALSQQIRETAKHNPESDFKSNHR